MRVSRAVRTGEAASRWFKELTGVEGPDPTFEAWSLEARVYRLVLTAFHLYAEEYRHFDVRRWNWPFAVLRKGSFDGDQPWTVLFRRARELWEVQEP